MAQLAVWLTCCLALAWITRARPIHAVCAVLAIWSLIPDIAGHVLTGQTDGSLAFHPATWLVLAIFGVQLMTHSAPLIEVFGRHIYLAICIAIFVCGALVSNYASASGGFALLLNQIVGPTLLFWLITAFAPADARRLVLLRNTILGVVAVQCILAFVQSRAGVVLFFTGDYESLYWFDPLKFDRWMGTTDSPLVLSLAICIAAPMTLGLSRDWARFGLLLVYVSGTIVTQSRTGVATMCLLLLYVLVRARMGVIGRTLYAALLVVAGYVIATSPLVTGISSRISNDTGSTQARGLALDLFAGNWTDFLVTGSGMTSSYRVASDWGLQTSLESSYLMYAVDVGIVLTTVYFGAQFFLIFRYGRQHLIPGATVAALIGCTLQHTFSAIAGSNLGGALIWTTLAMVVAAHSMSVAEPGETRAGRTPADRASDHDALTTT